MLVWCLRMVRGLFAGLGVLTIRFFLLLSLSLQEERARVSQLSSMVLSC